MSQALLIRCARVLAVLAEVSQCTQSRRAMVLVLFQAERASGAAASAAAKSDGMSGSGSCSTGMISSVTSSSMSAPAASRSCLLTRSQWLNWPSGSSVARKPCPLMVPSTVVLPRLGSFSLASLGRMTNAHEVSSPGFAGRRSVALNRDLLSTSVISNPSRILLERLAKLISFFAPCNAAQWPILAADTILSPRIHRRQHTSPAAAVPSTL